MSQNLLEQPKKPASAYFMWFAENREALQAETGAGAGRAVAKVAGERWKQLSADESEPFEERAAKARAEYKQAMADFLAQGGVRRVQRHVSAKGKRGLKQPAPKKPWGGAYGVFFAEQREAIGATLPEESNAKAGFTALQKEAARRWKEMTAAERQPYRERHVAMLAEHAASEKGGRPAGAELVRSASVSQGPAKGWKVLAWRTLGKAMRWKIMEPRAPGRPFRTFSNFRALRGSVDEKVYAQLRQAVRPGLVRRLDGPRRRKAVEASAEAETPKPAPKQRRVDVETPEKALQLVERTTQAPTQVERTQAAPAAGASWVLVRHARCGGSAPPLLRLKARTAVGRGEQCDARLECRQAPQMISRCHAVIECTPDACTVTDKSVNGILVNGKRALGTSKLFAGDIITFGAQTPEPELDYVLEPRPQPAAA